jgi:hypothetical protein
MDNHTDDRLRPCGAPGAWKGSGFDLSARRAELHH